MGLRLIGAGLGRTGTSSLKQAIERLTGAPCYHMTETFGKPEVTETWHRAVRGQMPDWRTFLAGYAATLDWPACRFWRELASDYPDVQVLLSTRSSAEVWWGSMEQTIVKALGSPTTSEQHARQRAMTRDLIEQHLGPDWRTREACIQAYERHNAEVRAVIAPDRLVEWQPGDGWAPLCDALGEPVPDEPFPHTNTAAEFQAAVDEASAAGEQADKLRADTAPP
jgi:sulfotransferase family protein